MVATLMHRTGLLLSALAVAIVWLLFRPTGVLAPLYDGIPLPPEPYRYLSPPPGVSSQPPTSVDHTINVQDEPFFQEVTQEQPPQAQIIAQSSALTMPAGVTQVRIQITPVSPPLVLPPGGRIDGNVYRFSMTVGGNPITLASPVTIILRGPANAGNALVELYNGGAWQQVGDATDLIAADTYEVKTSALGEITLIVPSSSPQSAPPKSGSLGGVVIAAIALMFLAVLIFSIRRLRRSSTPNKQRR